MNLNLEGKVAIVTGGAKGIGEAVTRLLAAEGATVIIADLDEESTKRLASSVEGVHAHVIDLVDEAACKDLIDRTVADHGSIDIVVNNAGVNDKVGIEASPDAFRHSLEKNLVQVFTVTHFATPHLKASKGSIVNITSKVATTGQGNTSGYAAAKGGVNALTREWAVDLARHGVRVNAVAPAETLTPRYEDWLNTQNDPDSVKSWIEGTIPLGNRFTTAIEIAHTAVFLASPAASHTTGQIVYVDGGYTHLDRAFTQK